jgi:hypothetical protein
MRAGALPLQQQLLIAIAGPPVMVVLWWLASRGIGLSIQGGSVSDRTKQRQRRRFWILLAVLYAIGFGTIIYAHLTSP